MLIFPVHYGVVVVVSYQLPPPH